MSPNAGADWLRRGKVLSKKMEVLGDVDEIAVAKLTTAIHGLRLHVITSGQWDLCGAEVRPCDAPAWTIQLL